MMSVIALTSCTTWDDPVTENYGDGPSISIDLQAVAPTDSAFNVTLTPAAGATYYAYIIDANDEAETLDASTLIKGGYGNTVVNVSEKQTLTLPITTASPNTTYQVYAVACNDKGVVGPVANKSIKTSDAGAPYPVDADADPDAKTFYVQFSEDIAQGDGKIIVTCYKEWDITNPVELTDEEVEISVDGDVVTVVAPNTPDGAFLTLSWEEGAFVDGFGNKCAAFRSYLNLNTGKWIGLYVRNTLAPFEINDTNIVSPENEALVTDYKEFEGKIEMPFEIFRNDDAVEDGAVKVIYVNEKKTTIHNLTPEQWSVSGKTLTFSLPVKPDAGDIIKVALAEEAIFDVCGNPNEEFIADEVSWLFFAPTLDMILGNFDVNYYSAYDEEPKLYNGGTVTIEEDPEVENGLIFSNLLDNGNKFKATYDLGAGKIYLEPYDLVGFDTYNGAKIGLILYCLDLADFLEFTINADGTITTSNMGLVAYDETLENPLGWWEKMSLTTLTPAKASAKKALKAKKTKVTKNTKVKKVRVTKRIRH